MKIKNFTLIIILINVFLGSCTKVPDYQYPSIKVLSEDNDVAARLNDTIVYKIKILSDNPLESIIVTPSRPGAEGTDDMNMVLNGSIFNLDTTYTYIVNDEFPSVNTILLTFEVTNKIGTSSKNLELKVARPINEFTNVHMDLTNCYFNAIIGQVVNYSDRFLYLDGLNFKYYLNDNNLRIGSINHNLNAPDSILVHFAFTGFLHSSITDDDFESIIDSRGIISLVGELDAPTISRSNPNYKDISEGDVFGYVDAKGTKGVIKINSISNEIDRPVIISVKSFNSD
jgi:hypothetical protein